MFIEKYLTKEQSDKFKKERSDLYDFDLWTDKGARLKKMLEEVGFTNIKLWEQPMNRLHGNGVDFLTGAGFGAKQLDHYLLNMQRTSEEDAQIRQEAIKEFDNLAGSNSTKVSSFQVVVVMAHKP